MTRLHGKDLTAVAQAKMGETAAKAVAGMALSTWTDAEYDYPPSNLPWCRTRANCVSVLKGRCRNDPGR